MESEGVRKRPVGSATGSAAAAKESSIAPHQKPSSQGNLRAAFGLVSLIGFFLGACLCMHFQQFLGLPLYFYNKDWYYAWQALVKQNFGVLLITVSEWWNPTEVRTTWDKSVEDQIVQTPNGAVKLRFPERIVQISNHQLYTDWVYLWWSCYSADMHGHIFIILKESLKYIPMIGPGMILFGFIFLSRHWETDKPRFQHRLRKLKSQHRGPLSGSNDLDPMWLMLFPEGTTLCENGRIASAKWAAKTGVADLKHTLIPRSRGLQFCMEELEGTVDWIYDCTIVYDGLPEGVYGQDYFTMKRIYLEDSGPKTVHMHWRRFAVSSIPLSDSKAFDTWLYDRWAEKDALLEYHLKHGHFPSGGDNTSLANESNGSPVESAELSSHREIVSPRAGPKHRFEFVQIFVSLLAVPIFWKIVPVVWKIFKFFIRVILFLAR